MMINLGSLSLFVEQTYDVICYTTSMHHLNEAPSTKDKNLVHVCARALCLFNLRERSLPSSGSTAAAAAAAATVSEAS